MDYDERGYLAAGPVLAGAPIIHQSLPPDRGRIQPGRQRLHFEIEYGRKNLQHFVVQGLHDILKSL